MANVYFFGEYKNYYDRIDKSETEDRRKTKWRSASAVPDDSTPWHDDRYWYIGFNTHLVYLTDIEYQLRTTDEIHFSRWITYAEDSRDYSPRYHRGRDFYVRFTVPEYSYSKGSTNPNGDRFGALRVPTPKQLPPPQFIAESEERLELGYDYGVVGGPEFKTEIIEVADDREQRNALWLLPRGRWQLGDRMLLDSETDLLKEVSKIKQFHLARKGSFEGFRFKDWSDYWGNNELIAVGDGTSNQFQLRKAYRAGNVLTYRPIQKPVEGTVEIFIDNVSESRTWAIDYTTGIISHTEPLPVGASLHANFEFDVPAQFESDSLPITLEHYDPTGTQVMYRLGSVFVIERKLPLSVEWKIGKSKDISTELDLGIVYGTVETFSVSNNKLALSNGYTKHYPKRDDQRLLFNLGEKKLDKDELDLLLGYFWNAKGKCKEFLFKNKDNNYVVRFNTDKLNLKFEAMSGNDALFNLQGLKLQGIKSQGFLDLINRDTFVYVFIDTSGSMDSSIPAIDSALFEFRALLRDRIYGTDEATDLKFKRIEFSHERWLQIPVENFSSRAVYLIWINEAAPVYHQSQGSHESPTSAYLDDFNQFLTSYSQRLLIKLVVYSIYQSNQSFDIFQNHLIAAYKGTSGYPQPLAHYNVDLRLNIPDTTTAASYFDDFTGLKILGSEG